MTDDFHLFANPDDGEGPIDADVALVSAYFARELSPMQVLALEERLATDAVFRAKVQPLIDAWGAPVGSLEGGAMRRVAPLTVLEKAESWRRFQEEDANAPASAPTTRTTERRIPMRRIVLLVGAVALPMVSFAQAVSYAADHSDAPGHSLALRIVAAFRAEAPSTHAAPVAPVAAATQAHRDSARPAPTIEDMRLGRQLSAAKAAAPVAVESTHTIVQQQPTAPSAPPLPDRARIAELARQYHSAAVRGDTAVEYIVMLLDAADNYVWSTMGTGSLSIEVAGDTRSPVERNAYTREHRNEYLGDNAPAIAFSPGGRGAAFGGGGPVGGGRGRGAVSATQRPDTPIVQRSLTAERRITRRPPGDTGYALRADTPLTFRRADARGARGRGGMPVDAMFDSISVLTARVGGIVSGGRGGVGTSSGQAGTYLVGWGSRGVGALINQAFGLREPARGESGILGLPSASLSSAETYYFGSGDLAPGDLKIVVLHLTAGTTWRRGF